MTLDGDHGQRLSRFRDVVRFVVMPWDDGGSRWPAHQSCSKRGLIVPAGIHTFKGAVFTSDGSFTRPSLTPSLLLGLGILGTFLDYAFSSWE